MRRNSQKKRLEHLVGDLHHCIFILRGLANQQDNGFKSSALYLSRRSKIASPLAIVNQSGLINLPDKLPTFGQIILFIGNTHAENGDVAQTHPANPPIWCVVPGGFMHISVHSSQEYLESGFWLPAATYVGRHSRNASAGCSNFVRCCCL